MINRIMEWDPVCLALLPWLRSRGGVEFGTCPSLRAIGLLRGESGLPRSKEPNKKPRPGYGAWFWKNVVAVWCSQ
jgi:hypothetical protein